MLQLLYTIPDLRQLLKTINVEQIVKSELKSVKTFDSDFNKAKNLIILLKNIFEGLEKGECVQLTRKKINSNSYLHFLVEDINNGTFGEQEDSSMFLDSIYNSFKVLLNIEIIKNFLKKINNQENKHITCKQGKKIVTGENPMPEEFIHKRGIRNENIAIEKEIFYLNNIELYIRLSINGRDIQECLNNHQSLQNITRFNIIDGEEVLTERIDQCKDELNKHGEYINQQIDIIIDNRKYIFIQLNRFMLNRVAVKINTPVIANKIIRIKDINFVIQSVVFHSGSSSSVGHYTCINFNEDGSPLSHIDSIRCRTIPYHSNERNIDNMINSGYIYLYRRID
jgi:hypothetical protein